MAISKKPSDLRLLFGLLFREIVREDKQFLIVGMIYAVVISFLTLAVPVSVQLLVSSVAHTASHDAVIALTAVLFLILFFSASLVALQSYVMEKFERRFYARITAEFTMRLLHADRSYFNSINRYELVNRYFDVTQVQKILPMMVVGLFATVLQTIVGSVVVASFNTTLLVFMLLFLLMLWTGWRIWGYRAIHSAIMLSEAKYQTARHLEDVARASDYFKSGRHSTYAIGKSDLMTKRYIDTRITHFRHVFSQQLWLLVLYVLANAALLGVGGNLVIIGELGLGQLIAAELILSGVFYGVSRFSYYLFELYSLVAALEEIYRVISVPAEHTSGSMILDPEKPAGLVFDNVRIGSDNAGQLINLDIKAGDKMLICSESYEVQSTICDIVKRYNMFDSGEVLIGGINIQDLQKAALRDSVVILDRPTIIEASVIEYLTVDCPKASYTQVRDILDIVELNEVIDQLPDKEQTILEVNGLPLTVSETLRLKLAAALLAKPHILIINEFFDIISGVRRNRIMRKLCAIEDLTVLYFSQQLNNSCFDRYIIMDRNGQREVGSVSEIYLYHQEEMA